MMEAENIFDSLITPFNATQFFERHWDKETLHVSRNDRQFYNDVLQPSDVQQFLSRDDIRYPALRMAKDGPTILPSAYSSILKFGPYASEGLINTDEVRRLHAEGATIILQMTRSSIPRLGLFANQLQLALQCNVETTVYATPPNSRGFTTHYDTHSVFILQVAGKKRWRLYDVLFELPTLDQTFDKCGKTPGPVRSEVVLEPGDLLYIPRGLGHDAIAEEGMSLHVTVGVFPPTYLDLLKLLIAELKDDVKFRQSPMNRVFAVKAETLRQQAVLLLQDVRGGFDVERLRALHVRNAMAKLTQNNEHRLFDSLNADEITLQTIVGRRREINCVRDHVDGRLRLMFNGKTLTFPSAVSPAIECMFEQETASIAALQANLSDKSKLNVARILIKEGLLRIHSLC